MDQTAKNTLARKTRVATLSVVSNSTLVVVKLVAGVVVGSVSVISEAIHSAVDLLAAGIALFAVRTSGKPPDETHPFGHGKIENISGTLEALLIFLAAGWIVYEAVDKLRHPRPLQTLGWGIAVMLFSSVVNLIVSQLLFKVGRETESVALQADAWHLRTDVFTSLAVMAGLGSIWAGRSIWPGIYLGWLDPASAIGVALLICKAAYDLTRQSARDLLDAKLPDDEEHWIRERAATLSDACEVRALRTRKAGAERFVELDLGVPPEMTVKASHDLTELLEEQIVEHFGPTKVTVHIEPCERDDCGPRKQAKA